MTKDQLTIGYLTPRIGDAVGQALWSGVVDAAQERGAHLISYVGEVLRDAEGNPSPANVVYDLVDLRAVAGLISWASSLGGSLEHDQVVSFHRRYRPLPLVSITLPMEGIPSVSIDSYQGMRDLIAHLVQVHGYRRLAFIRGPAGHFYAQERYRAYADALEEHGIPLDADLVTTPAEFSPTAGVQGIRQLLDERRLRPQSDVEAVVTASDLPALGALAELQARQIKVPEAIALVGFNDVLEGRFATPPLTSVRLPFNEQGRRAVDMLLALLAGEPVPERVILPARLIVRQSCGCLLPSVVQAAAGPVPPLLSGEPLALTLAAQRGSAIEAMRQAAEPLAQGLPADWAAQLFDLFAAEVCGEGAAQGTFLRTLNQVLSQVAPAGGQVQNLQNVLSALRCCLLPCFGAANDPALRRAEDLWGQARVLVGEASQRARGQQMVRQADRSQALRQISQALVTAFDVAELTDVLACDLSRLGIKSCYLSLYEDAHNPTGRSRLILACDEGGRTGWGPDECSFPSAQLTPDGVPGQGKPDGPASLVLEPLYFREEQIGFALFGVGPKEGTIYEVLRGQISSSLKGALLFDETRQARLVAEKADRLKTHLLANVSHELRTPLNVIISCSQKMLNSPNSYGLVLPEEMRRDLLHIHRSAEHQLRLINDLLDLSQAEIGELDVYPEPLDPRLLLAEVFHSMADTDTRGDVTWHLRLPDRLPLIQADPVRLRQILLNLLSNALKFVERGEVVLGAEATPTHLHIWVQDTGPGIPPDMQERIFEPFMTTGQTQRRREGAGLGLSITRRLVALHQGFMTLESLPGQGSTFHVFLPLPAPGEQPCPPLPTAQPVLLLISSQRQPPAEIVAFGQRQGLPVRRLEANEEPAVLLQSVQPVALAWDLAHSSPGDWQVIQRLRNHPRLAGVPLILYGQETGTQAALSLGMTDFVSKPLSEERLREAVQGVCPPAGAGPILIVDDDPRTLAEYQQVVSKGCPGYAIRTATDGLAALACLAEETPCLVILDLMMPEKDGFEVLDWMRANERTRHTPVLVLSSRSLTLDDVKRLEKHALVTLQSKGIWSAEETTATLQRVLLGMSTLPPYTSALVKRVIAYFHQNYNRPLSRWEVAHAIDVSEDYLSRVFRRELGTSPWEYLTRYRILQAMDRLRRTSDGIGAIAHQVGFRDPAYFCRVFRKVTGLSPSGYRKHPS